MLLEYLANKMMSSFQSGIVINSSSPQKQITLCKHSKMHTKSGFEYLTAASNKQSALTSTLLFTET